MERASKKNRSGNWKFWVILGGLVAVIVVLSVAIIAAVNRPRYADWDDLEDRLAAIDYGDIEARAAVYQEFIDATSDKDDLALLLEARLDYILDVDIYLSYGDMAIADAIGIDDILQSASSAGQVVNVASSYGDMEICVRYNRLMMERQGLIEGVTRG